MPLDSEADEVEDTSPLPPVSLSKKATVESVREAITTLPIDFREVVVLRELQGLSYKEISHVSGIPLGTVMSRLARARRQLYLILEAREDIDRELHSTGASPPQPQPCQPMQQVAAAPGAQQVPSAAWTQ